MTTTQKIMLGECSYTVELLSDDGNGHRLWLNRALDKVVNEDYSVETGESVDWNGDVAGWNYDTKTDVLPFA